MKAVLRLPAYRRLLIAYALNEVAWSVGSVALAFLVYHRTGSALAATAYFLAAQFLPAFVAPVVVARLERLGAGRALSALYGIDAMLFLVLAGAASSFSLAIVLALVFAGGIVGLVARPIARATTAGVIGPAGLLREGNAVTNTTFAVCIMVGPIAGGALVAAGGAATALLVDCGMFVVVALTLISTPGLAQAESQKRRSGGRVRLAIAQSNTDLVVRRLLMFQAVALVFFSISVPVEVVFAEHSLHAGAGGYGALLSSWGAGAIAGSVVYARWRASPGWLLIGLSSACMGIGFLLLAVAPTLLVAVAGSAIGGIGNGIEAVAQRTALQEHVQERWMSLTMSLNESIFQAFPGPGILLGGGLAALAGPRAAFAVGGVGSLLAGVMASIALRPAGDEASGEASDELVDAVPDGAR